MPDNDVLTRRYDEYGWPEDAVVRVRAIEAEVERLREEIEGGWLALGFRRNPQHDVRIADGINRLRAMHAERLEVEQLREALAHARQMAHSPYRDPAMVLREVRGALGLDRHTPDPAGGED